MIKNWKEIIEDIIKDLIAEKKLYEKAIFLAENKDRKGKVNTYSICLWEKEYPDSSNEFTVPDRNYVIINIKDPASKTRPDALKLSTMSQDVNMPDDIEYVDNITPYYILEKKSENLREYFKRLIEHAVDSYSGKADSFGCCAKFEECSDARRCLHENQLYAKACSYRKNLEAGNVFYGSKSQ